MSNAVVYNKRARGFKAKGFKLGVSAISIACAAAISAPATAQDADSGDESDDNGVIIVTAQFREQNLQDTPIAITAFTGEALEQKALNNIAQVADTAPNVSVRPQGASFGPSVTASIRGAGQNDFNPAYEPGVGIYIDDVYYPQLTGAIFDLLDVSRVEILRGPQGTLTGRNSEGGAIKFYSKEPTGDGSGFVEGTYGSRSRIGLRGAYDIGLGETLAFRVSGVYKEQKGYVDRIDYGCANPGSGIPATTTGDCVLGKLGGVGYAAARGILKWEPSSSINLTISGDYVRDKRTIAGEVLLDTGPVWNPGTAVNGVTLSDAFICGKFCNYSTTGQPGGTFNFIFAPNSTLDATSGTDQSLYEGWGVSAKLVADLSDTVQFTSITGYRKFDTEFYTDDDLTPINTNFGRNFLKNRSFSQELRLNYAPSDAIDITIGGYYFDQSSVYDSFQDIRYVPVFPLQFNQPDPTKGKSSAVFGNLGWEITDSFTLNAGLRYTDESKEQTYYRYNLDGVTINPWLDPVGAANGAGAPGALTGSTAKYSANRLDYRVALDYRFSESFLLYGSVATGFKGGGSNPRPFNANQLIPFGPETVTAYEIGFKSNISDNRLRLNGAVFANDYKDLQIPVSACPTAPCAARLNAGSVRVSGLELEAYFRPDSHFTLDAGLSYINQKFDSSSLSPAATYTGVVIDDSVNPAIVGVNPGGIDPNDPPSVPKWKWNVGGQYRFDMDSGGSITPRLDVYTQSKQYSGANTAGGVRTRLYLPAFAVLNARITWENAAGDLSASLEALNLTNEYYFLSRFNLLGAGAGFDKALPASPREYGITIKKRF